MPKGFFCVARQWRGRWCSRGAGKPSIPHRLQPDRGSADSAVYGASKAAVMSLTRSMAPSLASKGVTVNALAPGMVDTDMWALIDAQTAEQRGMPRGEPKQRRIRRIPLGRPAYPADIANAAAFLASSDSDYMTGQMLNIDGGNVPS